MNRAYIAFGANLSNPRETLMNAVAALGEAGLMIDDLSSLWQSPAWPAGGNAPDYINAVMSVRTRMSAKVLMQRLLQIETQLGRVRGARNAPRVIDLDLVDYDGRVLDDPHCTLPHPRMTDRAFVLLPLQQVAPDWVHPNGSRLTDLLADLDLSQTSRV